MILLALLVAASTQPAVPANGVDEPPRRGTFTEMSLGVFTALGGSAALSNAQPYIGMTLGREIGDQVAVFASLGIGAASASCYAHFPSGKGASNGASACDANYGADSFGATFAELGGSFGLPITRRALVSLKLLGGFTDLSPGPVSNASGVPEHLPGFHFGAGLSLDYDTHLDHFAVGFDVLGRLTFARYSPPQEQAQTLVVPSLAVMPRIRYVF
jgi:hypothetical protein